MEFRTPVKIETFERTIDHGMQGLSLGSCFAGNIAHRMRQAKFHIADNPFGVLFNPLSIADTLEILDSDCMFSIDDLAENNGMWSCFAFHGSFSNPDPDSALGKMNSAVAEGRRALKNADYVIVTFGTAWVYEIVGTGMGTDTASTVNKNAEAAEKANAAANTKPATDTEAESRNISDSPAVACRDVAQAICTTPQHIDSEAIICETKDAAAAEIKYTTTKIAANCHKFPTSNFRRRRLSVAEIIERYDHLLKNILRDKHVIFTVSPVRHIKDGFPENTLSKAILIEAVSEIVARNSNADYFPAFEIMNDELRDYRFYDADMVHPSPTAVDYIWERFCRTAFSRRTVSAVEEAEKIAAAVGHRPLHPGSKPYADFMSGMLTKVRAAQQDFPEIDFSREEAYFSDGTHK